MKRLGWSGRSFGGLVVTTVLAMTTLFQPAASLAPELLAASAGPAAPSPTDLTATAALELFAPEPPGLESSIVALEPEPTVVIRIGLEPDDEEIRAGIESWMARSWPGYVAQFDIAEHEQPDVLIGTQVPEREDLDAILLRTTPWVAMAHFTSDVDEVALSELQATFRGERTSWAQLDGVRLPIQPVLVAADRGVGAAVLGLDAEELGDVDVLSPVRLEERAADLARERGLLMVMPLPLADARFRTLSVDGTTPLFQHRSEPASALVAQRWLGVRRDGWAGRDGVVRQDGAQFREGLIRFLADEVTPPELEVTTVTAVGDIIFGRKVDQQLVAYGDYTRPFHRVGDALRWADVTVANLECTLTSLVRPPHDWGTFSFGSSPRAIEGLRYAGIDVVSLANNHSRDMGVEPFLQMLGILGEAGIGYTGAGRDLAEAHAPAIVEVRGTRIAFLGYDEVGSRWYGATDSAPGTAAMSEQAVRRDVAAARLQADVVIPFFHWGVEYTNRPTERQHRVAHAAVEAGAAMVLGSHPHWVQAIEFYEGALISYGLGNFVFDQSWSTETTQGVILHTSFLDGRLASVRFVPIQIEELHQPRILNREAGRPVLDRMFSVSDL